METSKRCCDVVGATAISITCCSRRSAWPPPRPNSSLSRKPHKMRTCYRLLCRALARVTVEQQFIVNKLVCGGRIGLLHRHLIFGQRIGQKTATEDPGITIRGDLAFT